MLCGCASCSYHENEFFIHSVRDAAYLVPVIGKKELDIIHILTVTFLSLVAIMALSIWGMKQKLKYLEKQFGGKVNSKIFGADYILDDIELKYNFGSQYSGGSTEIKVKNKSQRPITVSLAPKIKWLFGKKENKFDELYEYKYVTHNRFDILTNDMKQFLVDWKKYDIHLSVSKNEFCFTTSLSPFYINRIERCMKFVLLVRERIKEYELNES